MEIFNPRSLSLNNKRKIAVEFLNRFLGLAVGSKHAAKRWHQLQNDYKHLAEPFLNTELEIQRIEEQIKVLSDKLLKYGKHPQVRLEQAIVRTPKPTILSSYSPSTPLRFRSEGVVKRQENVLPGPNPIQFNSEGIPFREGEELMPERLWNSPAVHKAITRHIEDEIHMVEKHFKEHTTPKSTPLSTCSPIDNSIKDEVKMNLLPSFNIPSVPVYRVTPKKPVKTFKLRSLANMISPPFKFEHNTSTSSSHPYGS